MSPAPPEPGWDPAAAARLDRLIGDLRHPERLRQLIAAMTGHRAAGCTEERCTTTAVGAHRACCWLWHPDDDGHDSAHEAAESFERRGTAGYVRAALVARLHAARLFAEGTATDGKAPGA